LGTPFGRGDFEPSPHRRFGGSGGRESDGKALVEIGATLKELLAAVKEQSSLTQEEDAEAPQGAAGHETVVSTSTTHDKPGHDLADLEELFGSMEQDHR
jgi:hypothetical protein